MNQTVFTDEQNTTAVDLDQSAVKRDYKDKIFCKLFSDPQNLLDLYRMKHPEDTDVTVDDIKPITLSSVLSEGTVDDIAFFVKDNVFFLTRVQSSWSGDIFLHSFLLAMEFYTEFLVNKNPELHRTRAASFPLPEVYVYYSGSQNVPETVSFAEIYGGGRPMSMDFTVRVMTTAPANTVLGQYDHFIRTCEELAHKEKLTNENVSSIINDCIEKNILRSFLICHRSEVMHMLEDYWDLEGIRRVEDEELREEVTQQVTEEHVQRLHLNGFDSSTISKLLDIPLDKVKSILKEV
ncbi:MAG: hypothetical protein KBS81_04035 [Spirochaetales bacterium]|nr:hypothetical protein [Candidatus Physcosoma equi]